MLILTRVFCVLLYARVRLSDTAFETHLRSWSLAWRSSYLSFQSSCWFVQRSHLRILETSLYLRYSIVFISISNVYSSFINYYSLSIPLHCITLCKWSMIDLFTVYFKFCQIFINNSVFWIIQVGYVWFYCRFEWSKIAGRCI